MHIYVSDQLICSALAAHVNHCKIWTVHPYIGIVHQEFIRNCEQLYEVVKQGITENYGLSEDLNEKRDDEEEQEQEDQVGPFSIVGYMKYTLGSKKWGDSICLILIASMWCVRISVVLQKSRPIEV